MKSPAQAIRVLVADDHPLMRRGIIDVLQECGDIVVVAEAQDGLAAQAQYRQHMPDVTLMDLAMPRCNGIHAIKAIRRFNPDACVIALSTYSGDGLVYRALAAGAATYLLKTALCEDFAGAVRAAHGGQGLMAPEVSRQLSIGKTVQLTPREGEVLSAVAPGLGNRDVARQLGMAEETVKGHLSNVMQKLEASDRTHAVVIAMRRGMLDRGLFA